MFICTYLRHRIGSARSESKSGMLDTRRGLIGPSGVRNLSKVLRRGELPNSSGKDGEEYRDPDRGRPFVLAGLASNCIPVLKGR